MSAANTPIPSTEQEALQWLLTAVENPQDKPHDEFVKAWSAVFFLYGGLHPDGCDDHGEGISHDQDGPERFKLIEPRLIAPYYVKSGWPVLLAPLAIEACSRFEQGLMGEQEFYPVDAQYGGVEDRVAQGNGSNESFAP